MAWQKHAPALAGISMALLGAPVASAQDATAVAGLTVHGTVRYMRIDW